MAKKTINEQYREQRLKVLDNIRRNEEAGGECFFNDVEPDPPSRTLMPDDVDYLAEKLSTKIKTAIAEKMGRIWAKSVNREQNVTLVGEENLRGITGGAVFTSNHFSMFENAAIMLAATKANKKRKFYRVVREGNFFMPGFIGFLLKYAHTLPISSNAKTMTNLSRSLETILRRGDFVLIYPEKSMWWNYRKPRPYKLGAFHYAAKAEVPVIPCFITMKDSEKIDDGGFPIQHYTVHIMPPIYPDKDKTIKENAQIMLQKNAELTKAKYEEVYGIPLVYGNESKNTEKNERASDSLSKE